MVLETENESFLDDSCCIVDVVKGGGAYLLAGFLETSETEKVEEIQLFKKF